MVMMSNSELDFPDVDWEKVTKSVNDDVSSKYESIDHKLLDDLFKSIKFKELKYPSIVQDAIDVLDSSVPEKMKLFVAINECSLLVSNLNNPIRLNSKTLVTTNVQNVMFAPSGASKDSTVNKIRSNFDAAYQLIASKMKLASIEQAKQRCAETEDGNTENWKEYFKGSTRTLFPAVSTDEGMMNQMAVLNGTGIGAYNMVGISELGSDLKTNPALMTNLKLMAMGYDLGNIASKIVKTDELQTSDIKGLNMNLLMFSSVHTLLKDKKVKERFVDYMMIQGARRSTVYMNNTTEEKPVYGNLLEMVNNMARDDKQFEKSGELLKKKSLKIIKSIPTGPNAIITFPLSTGDLSELKNANARELYSLYKVYNSYRSDRIPAKYGMKAISTKHLHWKALKLAGVFAMLSGRMQIDTKNMLQAISVVEYFNDDIRLFQIEVDKESYELIADYCAERAINGTVKVNKHTLIKNGFVNPNVSDTKLKELVSLMNDSYDNGVFTFIKGVIIFKQLRKKTTTKKKNTVKKPTASKPIEKKSTVDNSTSGKDDTEDVVYFSVKQYKDSKGNKITFDDNKDSKEYRNSAEPIGWRNGKGKFESIAKLLTSNTISFSPYRFGDGEFNKKKVKGYRSLSTIIDPSNIIVLDVDKTNVSMNDMHEILKSYQHVIGTTSNPDNIYKYRIILRLDRKVDLTPREWRKFYKSIADMLGIEVDTNINKASMFHGYDGSKLLKQIQGRPITTKQHIINAHSVEDIPDIKPVKSEKEFQRSWDERFDTFDFAYDCNKNRSITLYGAMKDACKLGWSYNAVKDLMIEINETIERPLDQARFHRTIIGQIKNFIVK